MAPRTGRRRNQLRRQLSDSADSMDAEDLLVTKIANNGTSTSSTKTPQNSVAKNEKTCSKPRRTRKTVGFDIAPDFLKHNRFILSGYRKSLSLRQCIKSCFWWTNESVNIWSHAIGVIWLMVLLAMDLSSIHQLAPTSYDVVVAVLMVMSFQLCLGLSVVFHVFNCCSENICHTAFKWDVFGVAWATFTFYWTGIYCAFSCFSFWRYVYWGTAFTAFCVTVGLHLWQEFLKEKYRIHRVILFSVWAVFGFVPTFHWYFLYGGWANPWVKTIVMRVIGLYGLLGMGFFFYLSRIPERFKPGYFDFIGSSHQWWHLFAVLSFWWWHNTGLECFRYLKIYGCPSHVDYHDDPWKPLIKSMNSTQFGDDPNALNLTSILYGL